MSAENETFRSGFVAIVGRPNVGKSTLLNAILGQKISIATPKPQTTRNRILGVHSSENGQIAFLDTPGIHRARGKLNRAMVESAYDAGRSADVLVFVTDFEAITQNAHSAIWGGDREILERLDEMRESRPIVCVVNKVDLGKSKLALLPAFARLGEQDAAREGGPRFAAVIPVSAAKKDNLDRLLEVIASVLPTGEPLFDSETLTDRAERFFAAELVREQILNFCGQEIPYGVAVQVESFEDSASDGKLYLGVVIHVEKQSHKSIVIGAGGAKLKEIGTAARKELSKFFERPVHLKTFVRVEEDWSQTDEGLNRFGYGHEEI